MGQTTSTTPGPPGKGISSSSLNKTTGMLTLTYTDGTSTSIGPIIGPAGPEGPSSAVGITAVSQSTDGTSITITLSNGTTQGPFKVQGPPGNTGLGIKSIALSSDGSDLNFIMTDNSVQTVPATTLKGPKGDPGTPATGIPSTQLMYSANGDLTQMTSPVGIFLTNTDKRLADANNSEISNDTTNRKALMLAGNKSGGNGAQVIVFDDLTVGRNLTVNNDLNVLGDSWSKPFQLIDGNGKCVDGPQIAGGTNNGVFGCNGTSSQLWQKNFLTGQLRLYQTGNCIGTSGGLGNKWVMKGCSGIDTDQQITWGPYNSLRSAGGNCFDTGNPNMNYPCQEPGYNSNQKFHFG
jgi:hypothetical protein